MKCTKFACYDGERKCAYICTVQKCLSACYEEIACTCFSCIERVKKKRFISDKYAEYLQFRLLAKERVRTRVLTSQP